MERLGWIEADWPAPTSVRAGVSTRAMPGKSTGPWAQGNLGAHVGDDPAAVAHNRDLLRAMLDLPSDPVWLNQVHGTTVFVADDLDARPGPIEADASVTRQPGVVLAIMTADCLPILITNRAGTEIAAIHAGWRGLAAGVLEATLDTLESRRSELRAWIGPAIGPSAFEVGTDVREAFCSGSEITTQAEADCFTPRVEGGEPAAGKWWCDLPRLATLRLQRAGLTRIHASNLCSFSDATRFYSHRRDRIGGRMASLIWIDAPNSRPRRS